MTSCRAPGFAAATASPTGRRAASAPPACRCALPSTTFNDTRSTRRVRNANRDLAGNLAHARATQEQFRLFSAYQRARHGDSEMATMTYADYRGMVEDSPVHTGSRSSATPPGRCSPPR